MIIKSTNSLMNLDGANVKELVNIDGKLAIVKDNIQINCYDCYAEVMAYKLATALGIPCCEAGLLDDGRSYSIVDRSVNNKLANADEFLGTSNAEIESVYNTIKFNQLNDGIIISWIKQTLFDLLTRQLDRNLTNFLFITDESCRSSSMLYPLFDNGLSLFSTTMFKEDLEFSSISFRSSNKSLQFIKSICDSYDLRLSDLFSMEISYELLDKIWNEMPKVFVNGNSLDSIKTWVFNKYNQIKEVFNLNGNMDYFA